MKESIYIRATKQAWIFTWKHKLLWFFGAFAVFLGQFGVVEFLGKFGWQNGGGADKYFTAIGSAMAQIGIFILDAANSYDSKIILFFLLTLLFCILAVFVFLSVVSQGVLLHAGAQSIKKKKTNISKSWHVGTANFWRLFFLNFFKKIIIALISIILGLSAYGVILSPTVTNSIFLTLLTLLMSLAGLVLSFLFFYSASYLVIEKESMSAAIQKAWKMFVAHPIVSFEIALLVVVFNLFFGIGAALGFIMLILPAVLFWFAVVLIGGSQIALAASFIASLIMFTMYLMIVGAGFTVFTTYIWTYTFMEMHGKGIKSHVIHFFRRLVKGE